jgi:hypothetical protein
MDYNLREGQFLPTSDAERVVMPSATDGPTRLGRRIRRGLPLLVSFNFDVIMILDATALSISSTYIYNPENTLI